MKAKRRVPVYEAEPLAIWLFCGSAAIEFRCRALRRDGRSRPTVRESGACWLKGKRPRSSVAQYRACNGASVRSRRSRPFRPTILFRNDRSGRKPWPRLMAALTPQRSRNSSTNSVPSMDLTSRISTGTCAPIARLCTRMSLAANALTECKSSFLYSVALYTAAI